ncbi:ATP-dependent helicase [Heliobacillus mobilis]|uniref:ATP-dependent helicase n=2 Tax=Heliobacterium mobile TaxID=28064 RepID=A0A6I3SJG8_HELMO|nr:ATP-dependent helicase [Heliobacterium mobile]
MTVLRLHIKIKWIPDRGFFLWSPRTERLGNDAWEHMRECNFRLFSHHASSFYGSFTDVVEDIDGTVGILVPSLMALELFANPPGNEFVTFDWSDEIRTLQALAPQIRTALTEERFSPDFVQWRNGKQGWKLEQGMGTTDFPPYVPEWISVTIDAYVRDNAKLQERWGKIVEASPLLQPESLQRIPFADEREWLETIGWLSDETPFQVGLRLAEPEEEKAAEAGLDHWSLQVVLQDKEDPNRIFEIDFDSLFHRKLPANKDFTSTVYGEDGYDSIGLAHIPPEWQPFGERIGRSVNKWLNLLPWLRPELTEEQAWEFLSDGSLRLAEAGITVFLPRWWEEIRRTKGRLKMATRSSIGSGAETMFGMQQIVQFDWKMALGDVELSEEEFQQAVSTNRRLLHIRGKWIQLDPEFVHQALKLMRQKRKDLSLAEILKFHFLASEGDADSSELTDELLKAGGIQTGLGSERGNTAAEDSLRLEVELNGQLAVLVKQLSQITEAPVFKEPPGFQGVLRPYQRLGFSWLYFLRRFGLGGCLADDMGLGKTIQWIAYLLQVRSQEKSLQPSLLICPTSVIGNWQKELSAFAPELTVCLHYGPQRPKGEAFATAINGSDLVVTSYNLAQIDEAELTSTTWDCICLDEAQNIKNVYTKQSMAVRKLAGRHRVALTGTPMENRLTELWSIMDFLNPGYLGTLTEFSRRFVGVIERRRESGEIGQIQQLIRPFLLRRVKKDPAIELDLPEKQEMKEYVPLTLEQASLYDGVIQEVFERLEKEEGMARRGVILAALTRLKQVCDHPALILKEKKPNDFRARSNKADRLLEMVEELRQEGDRCLIFTQYVEMGHLLRAFLQEELGEPVEFLHGGTPRSQRDEMIDRFQDTRVTGEKACSIMVLSLRAGGLGLNLTAANHVFHFDRWWNPAVENQATDRVYRIGQRQKVQVHKFISLGTMEERIDEMIERKQGLSDSIVGNGEAWITELSTAELREIFALRREWVGRE